MATAMVGVTRALRSMNANMNLPAMNRIMAEFEKQSEIMDMKEEIMNDTMDDVMDEEGDEEESEMIVGQIFDEIGISFNQSLGVAAQPIAGKALEDKSKNADDDLMARLESLRKE